MQARRPRGCQECLDVERAGAARKAQAVDSGAGLLRDAAQRGLRATATIAVAFGCPFEGDVDMRRVLDIAARLDAPALATLVADRLIAQLDRALARPSASPEGV